LLVPGSGVALDHAWYERQKPVAAERPADEPRLDVEHAIGKAIGRAGMTVMHLVGVDYHAFVADADPVAAAIAEGLRARQRVTDGIGFVAVRIIGMAAEARDKALQALGRFVGGDEVLDHPRLIRGSQDCNVVGLAQTFKTLSGASG